MITIPVEDWVFAVAALVGGVLLLITVVFDDILGGLLDGFGFDFGGTLFTPILRDATGRLRARRRRSRYRPPRLNRRAPIAPGPVEDEERGRAAALLTTCGDVRSQRNMRFATCWAVAQVSDPPLGSAATRLTYARRSPERTRTPAEPISDRAVQNASSPMPDTSLAK